jgi:hypothetical protein
MPVLTVDIGGLYDLEETIRKSGGAGFKVSGIKGAKKKEVR